MLPVAYASIAALAIFAFYVLPILVLYAREEEKLMVEHYGTEYREYQQRVGMFAHHAPAQSPNPVLIVECRLCVMNVEQAVRGGVFVG